MNLDSFRRESRDEKLGFNNNPMEEVRCTTTPYGRNNTAQLPCWAKIVAPRQTLLQLHLLPLPLATPLLHLQFFPLRSLIAAFTSRCRVRSSCTSHFFHRIVVEAQLLVARLSPELSWRDNLCPARQLRCVVPAMLCSSTIRALQSTFHSSSCCPQAACWLKNSVRCSQ